MFLGVIRGGMIWQLGGALAWLQPARAGWLGRKPMMTLTPCRLQTASRLAGSSVTAFAHLTDHVELSAVAVIVRCCLLEHAPGAPAGALVTALAPPVVEGKAGARVAVGPALSS